MNMKNNILLKLYKIHKLKKNKKTYLKSSTRFEGAHFEGRNKIGKNTDIRESEIGLASYIGDDCYLPKVKIGRFCSIGSWIKVITGNHPQNFVTTHPIAFNEYMKKQGVCSNKRREFKDNPYSEDEFYVTIGNDVWIGQGVEIKEGIKIGDGAIIGAGAIVLKDVNPYEVVAGVPAKVIKKRFPEEIIKRLEKHRFWEKDLEWLIENAEKLARVEEYLSEVEG